MGKNIKQVSAQQLFPVIKELLATQRQAAFTVSGMSMWPFLADGRDKVVVVACDPKSLRLGDIVLYRRPDDGQYILHRITRLRGDLFETTGDNSQVRDGYFPFSCIEAKVICIVRKGKEIQCGRIRWRFLFRLWMCLFPVRGPLLSGMKWLARQKQRNADG